LSLAQHLEGLAGLFKIGKELFTAEGPPAVKAIASLGAGIFLDLKYHDIPRTVARAVRVAAALPGLKVMNVHALGGLEMMKAAAAELAANPHRPKLLAVTVLTSIDARGLKQIGVNASPASEVLRLAKLARKANLDGVVCSAREVKPIRQALGPDFITAVGGVRPETQLLSDQDDQSRIMAPGEAIRRGASYLIVGRPITEAPDPAAAARLILDEVSAAERPRQGQRRR
jgi:orotidine-5'-phosphate decarboxylase